MLGLLRKLFRRKPQPQPIGHTYHLNEYTLCEIDNVVVEVTARNEHVCVNDSLDLSGVLYRVESIRRFQEVDGMFAAKLMKIK